MPANDPSSGHRSVFESIKHTDEDGVDSFQFRCYVYTLAYPDGRVFYVGKGVGDSIDDHEREARRGIRSEKCDIIRAIWSQGGEVVKRKVARFDSDEEALQYEHFLLSSLNGLANISEGSRNIAEVVVSPEDQRLFGASIRRFTDEGKEYWSAREMAGFLGYSSWAAFKKLIARAERFLRKFDLHVPEDFRHTTLTVLTGKDAEHHIDDVHLSRMGFLYVLQYADSAKVVVAHGKSYVAEQMIKVTAPDEYRRLAESQQTETQIVLSHRSQQRLRQPQTAARPVANANKSSHQFQREEARRLKIEAEDRLGLFAQLNAPDGPGEGDGDEQRPIGNDGGE